MSNRNSPKRVKRGGGTTRPLPKDGGAEEPRGDQTVGPHPKVWTIGQELRGAKDRFTKRVPRQDSRGGDD